MARKPLDRSKLTPLSIEVIDARDAILRVLAGLRDDRKALMALSYAFASYADHLAVVTRHSHADVIATLAAKALADVEEGAMVGDMPRVADA